MMQGSDADRHRYMVKARLVLMPWGISMHSRYERGLSQCRRHMVLCSTSYRAGG